MSPLHVAGVVSISVKHIKVGKSVSRSLVSLVSVLLLVSNQLCLVVAHAQVIASEIDIDPPVIDHESLVTGVAGEVQIFSALVVDDRGIEYVDFYHRSMSGADYAKVAMEMVAGTANFAVTLETDPGQSKIEYYIEAADSGGNRVLKGFPFFPLVRNLTLPATPVSTAVESNSSASGGNSDNRWIFIALGAVALGVLASAVAGGDNETPVTENEVPLTINISSPLN